MKGGVTVRAHLESTSQTQDMSAHSTSWFPHLSFDDDAADS